MRNSNKPAKQSNDPPAGRGDVLCMADRQFSVSNEQSRERSYRRIYPLRVIGMGLGGLSISSVLVTGDIQMIAPQHGAPIAGAAIGQLLDWLEGLVCGIDLMGPGQYQIPMGELNA